MIWNVKWTQYAARTLLCVSALNVSMHILIHKVLYWLYCDVAAVFQLFPIEPALLVFFSGLLEQKSVTDDYGLIWAYCMLAFNINPSLCQWRDFWPTNGLLLMIYVCLNPTFVTGHLTDKHQVCMLDITACHSMFFLFLFFSFNCFVNYFIK